MFRSCLVTTLVVPLLCAVASGQAPSDPFTGVFKDPKITLILKLVGGGAAAGPVDRYTGEIHMGEQKFSLSGTRAGRQVQGTFRSADNSFEFTAVLNESGNALTLATGSARYVLHRQEPRLGAATYVPPAAEGATTEALQKTIEQLLATAQAGDQEKLSAALRPLVLPDAPAWFKKVFGEQVGARLAEEYAGLVGDMDKGVGSFLLKAAREGQTQVSVLRIADSQDPNATGLQATALKAMKEPVPLYSVRLTKPGEKVGLHLWSFVHDGTAFRLVGKMRQVQGASAPPAPPAP